MKWTNGPKTSMLLPRLRDWLLTHKEYQNWVTCDQGLLWIKGKPGAGKSPLQQYALDNIIVASHIGANALVLSFFFHGRGADLERTVPGLFRSLLYQLLSRGHTVWSELKDLFPSTTDESDKKWQCELPKLKKFASESLGESLGLVIGRRTRRMWRRAGGRPYPVLQGPAGLSQVLICCPSAISHLFHLSPISSSRSRHWVRNMPRE